MTPLLIQGPADSGSVKAVCNSLHPLEVPRLTTPPLSELLAMLQMARAYVGNDSGISHLAGAAGTPGIVFFGPTKPAVWRPLGSGLRIIEAKRLEDITVEIAFNALRSVLPG